MINELKNKVIDWTEKGAQKVIKYCKATEKGAAEVDRYCKGQKTTDADEINERMENRLKPGYARESEASLAERAWNYCFEPEHNANDCFCGTMWKGGRENAGDFLKGAAAPYAISTAKNISDDSVGSKSASKAKVVGALASAILTAYFGIVDPSVDKVKDYMADREKAALVVESDSLKKDQAALELRINAAQAKIKSTTNPAEFARTQNALNVYDRQKKQNEEQKTTIDNQVNAIGDGYPISKGGISLALFALATNSLSAFYESHRKKAIYNRMGRIKG